MQKLEVDAQPSHAVAKAREEKFKLEEDHRKIQGKAADAERALIEANAIRQHDDTKRMERIADANDIDGQIRHLTPLIELLGPDGVRATVRNMVIHNLKTALGLI